MRKIRMYFKGNKTWSEVFKRWIGVRPIASAIVLGAIALATGMAGLIFTIVPPIVTSVDLMIGYISTVIVGPIGAIIVDLLGIPLVSPTPDLGTFVVGLGFIIMAFGYAYAYKVYLESGSRVKMVILIWITAYVAETIKWPIIAAWVVYIYKMATDVWAYMLLLAPGLVVNTSVAALVQSILMVTMPKFMRPLWTFYEEVST